MEVTCPLVLIKFGEFFFKFFSANLTFPHESYPFVNYTGEEKRWYRYANFAHPCIQTFILILYLSFWLKQHTLLPQAFFDCLFTYLSENQDQVNLMLVCKSWATFITDSMYHAPPLQTPDSFERLLRLLNTPLPYYPYPQMIKELDISPIAADNIFMGDLDSALSLCTNLQVFRLENCYHISNILVQSLSRHSSKLLQLELSGCPISDSFVPALVKNNKFLERIDLGFTNVTFSCIIPIVDHCANLVSLDLSECNDIDALKGREK